MVSCDITLRLSRASRTKPVLHFFLAVKFSAFWARLVIFVTAAIADLNFSSMAGNVSQISIPEIFLAMQASGIMVI